MTETASTHRSVTQAQAAAVVLRQFRQVFSTVRRHFQSLEKIAGLGGAQIWALSEIAANAGCGVNQLAIAMDIHQSTASNLVKSLMKADLIESKRAAQDKRVVELFALPAGLRILKKIKPPHCGILPHTLRQLNEKSLKQLELSLAILIAQMQTDESAAHTPIAML
jgi:DNA-binding MarR family transcriptional regulator